MIITVDIHQMNKNFSVTVHPKHACKFEFADYLWILFIDQPRSDIVFFAIMTFLIYYILVKKW